MVKILFKGGSSNLEKFNLLPLLDYIEPSSLDYTEWVQVGMALKEEGYTYNDWDSWSQRDDARYHEGECEKKWETFDGTGSVVTGATITQMAKENGWGPKMREENKAFGWNDSIEAVSYNSEIDKDYKLIDTSYMSGEEIKEPKVWNPAKQITKYLETLFDPGDVVGFVNSAYQHEEANGEVKWIPASSGVYTLTAGDIIDGLRRNKGDVGAIMGDPNPEAGAWIRFNPLNGKGVKNDDVTEFKYALVESDSISVQLQNEIYQKLELPIATLVYTGKKSLHAVVKVNAKNYPQYKDRVDYLYEVLNKNGLKIDKQNKNPSRLTRLPGFVRGNKKQFLVATNIGKANWDEWTEYIEDLNDNLPEMESLENLFDEEIVLAPELISGVLRKGHKMLIAGPSKAGKSFALIQLAIAIAEGQQWFGFNCMQGKVLYVNLELDGKSAKKRFVDIYNTLGLGHQNIKNIDIWNLRGKTSPMDKLTPKLIRRAKDAGYIAIIIDPIYKVLTGDENNAHDMSIFVNQFDRIATELSCSVIYAHHHSKGAQGGKNSMDRSSGSGVFARDPDAILDLIELPIDEERYDQLDQAMICETIFDTIKVNQPDYLQYIKPSERYDQSKMERHLMTAINGRVANAQEILKTNNERCNAISSQVRQQTAWRLEGTLREFPKFKPVNVWFKYPIHILDPSLAEISLEEIAQQNWKKKTKAANQNKSEKVQKELEEAFNVLSEDGGPIEVNAISTYLEIGRTATYNRIKKSDKFYVEDGMINKK